MDIHDVSGFDWYKQILDNQLEKLKAAGARQGTDPIDRGSRSRLVSDFMLHHMEQKFGMYGLGNGDSTLQMQSAFVPPPYAPASLPLEMLERILIKHLRLETHHRGTYLLLRSITPPNSMTAIMAICEDEEGDAVLLELYHQDDKLGLPITAFLQQQDVIVVKEPYFKVMADGTYGVRVDHVSDLIRIEPHGSMMPPEWMSGTSEQAKTADACKREGNEAMRNQEAWKAILCYDAALSRPTSVKEIQTIKLNRSLAYLKNDHLDAALLDTDCLKSPSDAPEKALYRAGQALYRLERFSDCHEILELLSKRHPENKDALLHLERVRCRLAEQETGIYDHKAILEEARRTRPPHLDHATYVGPITVKTSDGRGRGWFTTKAVKAGDLLLCEKAFAHCSADPADENSANLSKTSLLINVETKRMTIGTQVDLVTKIAQKLWRNPSYLSEFASLYHRSYEPVAMSQVDGKPVVDTFLIERVVALNAFGCDLASSNRLLRSERAIEGKHHSCGVWPKASLINHSCYSTVHRSFIGDLLTVHATCDIPIDTELSFWYHVPTDGNSQKTQKGLQHWGFECKCAICVDSNGTSKKILKKREALLGDVKIALSNSNTLDPAKAERLLTAVESTYKSRPDQVPRLAIWVHYFNLTRAYASQNQPDKVIRAALKTLRSLGFVLEDAHTPPISSTTAATPMPLEPLTITGWGLMFDNLVETWVHLWTAYSILEPHLCGTAERYAKTFYRICFGEVVTFEETYGKRARKAMHGRMS